MPLPYREVHRCCIAVPDVCPRCMLTVRPHGLGGSVRIQLLVML